MFDKVFQTTFVCLRCRSRLLHQQPPSSSPASLWKPKFTARWQSTTVARVEEEDNSIEDSERVDREDAVRHDSADSVYLRPKGRRKAYDDHQGAYRTFRPDRVSELGVSSLGKPAEVIVLQPRNRYIPRLPTEEDGHQDPQLLEALQAETAPLDPEQVKHNIEQIKKPFGEGGRILEEAQWKELRHNLVKGFTHVQLLDYIRHMEESKGLVPTQAGESSDASSSSTFSSKFSDRLGSKPDMKQAGRHRIKKRAAVSIMKDIWGFSPPASEEAAEDVQSVTVVMSRRHIGALKAQKAQAFRNISEALHVKIDMFKEKSKLVIHGHTNALEEAKKVLLSMRNQIKSMDIELGTRGNLLPGLQDGKLEQRLLEEVGRNRPVYIEKKNFYKALPSLRIFYHESQQQEAEAARRDILLASHRTGPRSSISIWPPLNQQPTWLVPCTPSEALPWWERQGRWGRWSFLRTADTDVQTVRPSHEPPTDTSTMEFSRRWCNANASLQNALKSELLTQQITAVFGQAIFRRDVKQQLQSVLKGHGTKSLDLKHGNVQTLLPPPSSASAKMVTDVPLLAQSLASCKPWSSQQTGLVDSKPQSDVTGHFIHRLLLVCATADSPPLQVLLKGDDAQLGLQQPLQLHSISAILEERSHVLLLPDRVVDIEFRGQTQYHFYTAHRKKNSEHLQFLDQFLDYLNQAQGQEVPGFAPFVTLNLPPDLTALRKRLGFASASVPKGMRPPLGSTSTTPSTPSATLKLPRNVGASEYMLAVSETLDVASFSHSAAKGLCLDHVQVCGLDDTQSRQELRLAERPYPDVATSLPPFPGLFDSAYAVASWLGDPKVLKEKL